MHDWTALLADLNRLVQKCPASRQLISDDALARGWLGYPPADAAKLDDLERRLGVRLPPSYRGFLAISDG